MNITLWKLEVWILFVSCLNIVFYIILNWDNTFKTNIYKVDTWIKYVKLKEKLFLKSIGLICEKVYILFYLIILILFEEWAENCLFLNFISIVICNYFSSNLNIIISVIYWVRPKIIIELNYLMVKFFYRKMTSGSSYEFK